MAYNVTVSGKDYVGVDSVKLPITDNDGVYATFVDSSVTTEIIEGTLTSLSNSKAAKVLEAKFKGCTNLTKVELPAVTTMMGSAFMNCPNLTDVSIPLWAPTTGHGGGHFQNCTSLKEFTFQNSHVPTACFSGCTAIEKVDVVGKAVGVATNSVGASAFVNCSNLKALILRNTSMATLVNVNAFTDSAIAFGTGYIYVPSALVDSYKAASNWSTYAAQFRAIEDYPDICG